ncbi:MAG TPA: MFS transporter [Acidimicrobiales bacterium]|nr:MFS transporter [Acidimicrobiales bacterium]
MRLEKWLGALHERNFRLYFVGQLTSAIGTGMTPVALSFAVLALRHGSATDVGAVLTAETVPLVVFLLVGGVAGDRFGRRRVMLGADVLRTGAQAALGTWILLGHPPLWGFLLFSALVGTGTAFFMPALTGLIPEVVQSERLTQANALNGLTFSLGGIVGPAVAGIVVAAASPGWAIVADALSYAVSVWSLAALRLSPVVGAASESFYVQLRHGWKEFWSRTWLWAIVVVASVSNMLMMAPYLVLGAVIAKESLGGATAWGTILAAQGAGAVVGGVAMLRVRFHRPLVASLLSMLVWPYPLLSLAYRAPVPVIAVGAFLGGVAFAIFDAQWQTTMQREVPAEVLSRVSAYDWFGSLVFLPLGFVIVGPVAAAVGVHAVFLIGSFFVFVAVAITLLFPAVRQIRSPSGAA